MTVRDDGLILIGANSDSDSEDEPREQTRTNGCRCCRSDHDEPRLEFTSFFVSTRARSAREAPCDR